MRRHHDRSGLRDRAIIAMLLGCARRRPPAAALTMGRGEWRDGRRGGVEGHGGAGGASRARSNGSHPPAPGAPGVVIATSIADGGRPIRSRRSRRRTTPRWRRNGPAGTKQREASAMGAPGLRVSAGPRWRRARWAASSGGRAGGA